jgi:hypothetical protein
MALPQTLLLFRPLLARPLKKGATVKIAYIDESGTPELTGSTSHFVLLAATIEAANWKAHDEAITAIKHAYGVSKAELHAGWMARRYVEQELIHDFSNSSREQRVVRAMRKRDELLLNRAARYGVERVRELRKNFTKTAPFLHLTHSERRALLAEVAREIASWPDCVLFAECTDKSTFGGRAPATPPFEEAFTQVVTRFHYYLEHEGDFGMLVQDRNETVEKRLTELMRRFHAEGNRYTAQIPRIIETPLFVDSTLTSMVQVADVCAYALRRYFENGETELFDIVYPRIRRHNGRCVGGRHYRGRNRQCSCRMCADH